jgi:hypothetical protein
MKPQQQPDAYVRKLKAQHKQDDGVVRGEAEDRESEDEKVLEPEMGRGCRKRRLNGRFSSYVWAK